MPEKSSSSCRRSGSSPGRCPVCFAWRTYSSRAFVIESSRWRPRPAGACRARRQGASRETIRLKRSREERRLELARRTPRRAPGRPASAPRRRCACGGCGSRVSAGTSKSRYARCARSQSASAAICAHAGRCPRRRGCARGSARAAARWSSSSVGVVLAQRRARSRRTRGDVVVGPGLLVDRQEKVERVEEEVAGAAGRVEDLAGRADPSSPRSSSPALSSTRYSHRSASCVSPPRICHHVRAERVVDEELDDVARREELVANGELAAVARRLRSRRASASARRRC